MTEDDVLDFWFDGDPATQSRDVVRAGRRLRRCLHTLRRCAARREIGRTRSLAATPRGTLALIILLDQFSRNLHRGSPEAFAADAKARQIARAAVAQGLDLQFGPVERLFLYLPFGHSEDLADQDESVRLFETLDEEQSDWARRHRDVIVRFGRFPHRNAVLGRTSTPEEEAYLAEPGAGF